MNKNFKEQIQNERKIDQATPAELLLKSSNISQEKQKTKEELIKEIEEEKEEEYQKKLRENTEENIKIVITFIENFRKLNPFLQELILSQLNENWPKKPQESSVLSDNKEFLSVAEAAEVLGLTERAVLYNLKKGNLFGEKKRNRWKISRTSIEEFRR